MNEASPEICPRCGQPVPQKSTEQSPAREQDVAPETDHRGVALPRRTRLGGIIIPQ